MSVFDSHDSDLLEDLAQIEGDFEKLGEDLVNEFSQTNLLYRIGLASLAVTGVAYINGEREVVPLLTRAGTMAIAEIVGYNLAQTVGNTSAQEPTAGLIYYLIANRSLDFNRLNHRVGIEALAGAGASYIAGMQLPPKDEQSKEDDEDIQ